VVGSFEGDSGLHAGELSTDAEVRSPAEADMLATVRAVDVDDVAAEGLGSVGGRPHEDES
jgi:hypothetical protein